ncbi:EamA family transporter [Myxococcota bacterium]|nr:EamA family transporter [Myxococcota bacterium]
MTTDRLGPGARGALFGLTAAALFGLSAPVAKVLLGHVPPVLLAGLLYLGAAIGLWNHHLVRGPTAEAALRREDAPWLAGIVVAGGLAGPVLMLAGLSRVTAVTGALLLNLEAPMTVLVAVALFREHLGARAFVAMVCIFAGALVLKLEPGAAGADALGVVLLAAACACWAMDNNLTQRLSVRDPFAIVRVKTLVAGVVNTALGLAIATGPRPSAGLVAGALVLGAASYGLSVVLDAYALRLVGAAREAAYFATAPFVGAIAALFVTGSSLRPHDGLAMAAMAAGVVLLLRERHGHVHVHEPLDHEHVHTHDAHHQHAHGPDDPPGEPHSHEHRHARLEHDHLHVPDVHHRHGHP